MHVYVLAVVPGPRRSAVARAVELLEDGMPSGFDTWAIGGRYTNLFGVVARPALDEWWEREEKRRLDSRAQLRDEHPDVDPDSELFEQLLGLHEIGATNHNKRLDLERKALIDMTRLTSTLPCPLPLTMIPHGLVQPNGRWRICPAIWEEDPDDPRWARWVNKTIDRYRGGHCVVVTDCHF